MQSQVYNNRGWIIGSLSAFAILVAAFCLLIWALIRTPDLEAVVEGHLTALRDHRITEAYYKYTSHEFQDAISLTSFRKFLKNNPILTEFKKFQMNNEVIRDDIGVLNGSLSYDENEAIPIEFQLVKEDDSWKILEGTIFPEEVKATKANRETIQLLTPIDAQLEAFRAKNYSAGYDDLVSKAFKDATPFDEFLSFVKKYPILTDHTNILVKSQSISNNIGEVLVVLDPDTAKVPLEYRLVQEDGKWKIESLHLILPMSEHVQKLLADPKTLFPVITAQFDALKSGDVIKAYHLYFSEPFQKSTTLGQFRNFLNNYPLFQHYTNLTFREPFIDNETGRVDAVLRNDQASMEVEFTLGIEEEEWKIWGIDVLHQGEIKPPPLPPTPLPPKSGEHTNGTRT